LRAGPQVIHSPNQPVSLETVHQGGHVRCDTLLLLGKQTQRHRLLDFAICDSTLYFAADNPTTFNASSSRAICPWRHPAA
jgi:hypothetical protein